MSWRLSKWHNDCDAITDIPDDISKRHRIVVYKVRLIYATVKCKCSDSVTIAIRGNT